jgi:hypothetical protein
VLAAALASTGGAKSASAQDTVINQNISGFNLPGVTLPQGTDEVRAADGTTCRSAVSGSGAYVDVGIIGNPDQVNTEASFSAYGRLVIPLGRTSPRLDCSLLYDLEVQRLAIELKLSQMGLNRGFAPSSEEISTNPTTKLSDNGSSEQEVGVEDEAAKKLASLKAEDKSPAKSVAKTSAKNPVKLVTKTSDWADDGWTTEGRRE